MTTPHVVPAPPAPLLAIDRVCDALLTGSGGAALDSLYPRDMTGKLVACMRLLRVLFPAVSDSILSGRLSAAYTDSLDI